MNVVWWFIVVVVCCVLDERNAQDGFSASSGNNLTNYDPRYQLTPGNYTEISNEYHTKQSWDGSSELITTAESQTYANRNVVDNKKKKSGSPKFEEGSSDISKKVEKQKKPLNVLNPNKEEKIKNNGTPKEKNLKVTLETPPMGRISTENIQTNEVVEKYGTEKSLTSVSKNSQTHNNVYENKFTETTINANTISIGKPKIQIRTRNGETLKVSPQTRRFSIRQNEISENIQISSDSSITDSEFVNYSSAKLRNYEPVDEEISSPSSTDSDYTSRAIRSTIFSVSTTEKNEETAITKDIQISSTSESSSTTSDYLYRFSEDEEIQNTITTEKNTDEVADGSTKFMTKVSSTIDLDPFGLTLSTDPEDRFITSIESTNSESTSSDVTELGTSTTDETEETTIDTISSTTETTSEKSPRVCSTLPELDLNVITANSSSVTLEWAPMSDNSCVKNYIIYLNGIEINTTDHFINEYTIDSLHACSEHTVGVAASDGTNIGHKAEESFNTTVPSNFNYTVQNLSVTPTPEKMLNITWIPPVDEVSQCVTSYRLSWWDVNNDIQPGDATLDAAETSYSIKIIPCTVILIQIIPIAGSEYEGLPTLYNNYTAEESPTDAPQLHEKTYGKEYINMTWKTDEKNINSCKITAINVVCNGENNSDEWWVVKHSNKTKNITKEAPDSRYFMQIDGLSPFTNYTCVGTVTNTGGVSPGTTFEVTTDSDAASAPEDLKIIDISPYNFTIEWQKPNKAPGIMLNYSLRIYETTSSQNLVQECQHNEINFSTNINPEETRYTFLNSTPYTNYSLELHAIIKDAPEGERANIYVLTNTSEPDSVRNPQADPPVYSQNETYHGTVKIQFNPPCRFNGEFVHYQVDSRGVREGFSDVNDSLSTNQTEAEVELLPQRNYTISITVITKNFKSTSESIYDIQTASGVPTLGQKMSNPIVSNGTSAVFTLNKAAFNNSYGDIVAYSLILKTTSAETGGFGFWNYTNETWPELPSNSIQLTQNFWYPFEEGADTVNFTIGTETEDDCSNRNYCNQILKENTEYWLLVRGLTKAAYKDSSLLYFQTEMPDGLNLALILGLIFGLLAFVILLIFLVILWRRRRKQAFPEEEKKVSTVSPTAIPVLKYSAYYINIRQNYNILKEQYTELGLRSKEVAGEASHAILPENKRKNRYTNILPYDATRVTLKIDEDDEISSDYINASYIKGYSGKVEYIATQGPLETTARDFWRMVLQENVSIIAMVSQFVEQSKEKCYQYFPNNHESVYFGESLEVKCSTELHFGTYCVRTLQVRKGAEQRDVVHMQFLEWPDFGVPQGTDNMLQFCNQLREKINREGGIILVHCSAGVGRTGTLIALDILLQTIDDHRDINIYKTVFDLRKQRTNMVQTEKQYMFIHTAIKDYLEIPTTPTNDVSGEHIYENMDVLRSSSLKKNLIDSEVESAL